MALLIYSEEYTPGSQINFKYVLIYSGSKYTEKHSFERAVTFRIIMQ